LDLVYRRPKTAGQALKLHGAGTAQLHKGSFEQGHSPAGHARFQSSFQAALFVAKATQAAYRRWLGRSKTAGQALKLHGAGTAQLHKGSFEQGHSPAGHARFRSSFQAALFVAKATQAVHCRCLGRSKTAGQALKLHGLGRPQKLK
jgi:rhodanese-related sulfurtransferase